MTASIDFKRIFSVHKDSLSIFVSTMRDDVTGAIFSHWAVFQDNRPVKADIIDGTHHLPAILKNAADNTTLRTGVLDMALRALTWSALENHTHVSASELRAGDVLSLHGYGVVIESVETDGDNVTIVIGSMGYHSGGTRRCMPKTQLCNLIQRGAA